MRDDLRLTIVSPVPADHPGGGSRPMADGSPQHSGGWYRIALEVSGLEGTVATAASGRRPVPQRGHHRVGGKQALVCDPSGNLVELFEPTIPEAHNRSAFEAR